METEAVVYYTCLNNHCPKHRNIFIEGSSEHANCERERFDLEDQRAPFPYAKIALAGTAVAAVIIAAFAAMRVRMGTRTQRSITGEEPAAPSTDWPPRWKRIC